MKRLLIGLIMPVFVAMAQEHDPILAVVLMVKDEEETIVETVAPFVEGGIQSYLIFDTGSTDKTIELITNYFKEKNITSFIVEQEPFIDYAASRNRALELANHHFPRAGFFIMPDAQWYIQNAHLLLDCCKQLLESNCTDEILALRIGNQETDFDTPRLFRAPVKIRFVGGCHEMPHAGTVTRIPSNIYFQWSPSKEGDERTLLRTVKDVDYFLSMIEKNPDDSRNYYYLAQSYCVLGDYHNALKYFKKRLEFKEFPEEYFMALYRIAQITEQLFLRNEATWAQALDCYFQAFMCRPTRAEPLVHVANYYKNNGCPQLAFTLAYQACNIAYPEDSLPINKILYEYHRYEIVACTAPAMNQWAIGAWALEQGLKRNPTDIRLQELARFYEKHQQAQA